MVFCIDKPAVIFAVFFTYGLFLNISGYNLNFSPSEEDKAGLPTILWWDSLGNRQDYTVTCGEQQSCVVTNNKSYFHRDKIMVYVYYGSNFLTSGLPLPRQDGDLWALVHEESPKNAEWLLTFESTLELFNYTATFKRESHYPFPIHWLPKEEVLSSKEYLVPTKEKNRLRREEKLAPVLFVHSDCSTPSNREGYVEKLMRYVDVDSYGSCLHNKDFPESYKTLRGYESFTSKEFLKFVAKYKFAIAFENAVCDDYITEKLWRPLHAGSVPIVFGSSKVKDFLPSSKSALVITDFDSIKDLADHIKHLDSHDDEYETYLQFKHTGISNPKLTSEIARMTLATGENPNFMTTIFGFECFLCDKLHGAVNDSLTGKPIPKSQASSSHLDCPLPTQKFDQDGRLVLDIHRDRELEFAKLHAHTFRELYNKGENVTSEKLYEYVQDILKRRSKGLKDEL